MKKIIILFLTMISFHLGAEELVFFEDEKKFLFHFHEDSFLMINHDCQKKCQAYLALNNISKENVIRDGGANPGAIICVEQLKGKIKTLTDKKGDQNSFCEFSDKSMVSLGTLQKVQRTKSAKQ